MDLEKLSKRFGEVANKSGLVVVTAESCTAGLIAATIAMTAGSSKWLDSGYVVYTPEAKNKILGVSLETIERCNITSREVAGEMARGALKCGGANFAMAVTGVAGPGGGTEEIPVGTVCMAWATEKFTLTKRILFEGERNEIRELVVAYMLNEAIEMMN